MTTPSPLRQATSLFQNRFASHPAAAASAPGRINLLGEHTDYNGGPVLPFAIDRRTVVAAAPGSEWLAVSTFDDTVRSFQPDADPSGGWSDYPRAVARAMVRAGYRLPGARLAVASSIPVGAGLSSSAALCLACVRALALLSGLKLPLATLVDLAWRAEHDELGVPCGRMDQTVIGLGTRGTALLIECSTGAVSRIPLPGKVWVLETGVTHRLVESEYARRRGECEQALGLIRDRGLRLGALAELRPSDLPRVLPWLPPPLDRRARHVATETVRTRQAAEALAAGDLAQLGRLMAAGHLSLRDDFQSSVPAADLLVDSVMARGGVGARLTGAGWGGAVIALLPIAGAARILADVAADFSAAFGAPLIAWSTSASEGVRREQVE